MSQQKIKLERDVYDSDDSSSHQSSSSSVHSKRFRPQQPVPINPRPLIGFNVFGLFFWIIIIIAVLVPIIGIFKIHNRQKLS